MKSSVAATFLAALAFSTTTSTEAFAPFHHQQSSSSSSTALSVGYVPAGLSPQEYKRIQEQDRRKVQGKEFARVGPKGFKSRSMQAWQEARDRGEVGHSFAPLGYRQKLADGTLKRHEIPYMVRGGSWDNSDVLGFFGRLPWSQNDKKYAKGGYKKEQSVSILGSGPGFDWTGQGQRDERDNRRFPGFF